MSKENPPPDKRRDKPPPPSQNPTSVFIVWDCMIKKVDGYFLTSSLKDQHLVKTRTFSTEKTIDIYNYLKQLRETFNQKCPFCTLE